ncbi:MAG: BMC domain-containing protein [bacterium]|jgi:microcompartment protein CcmL/EutN
MKEDIEAIGMVELNSIATGIMTCDEMLKVAPVVLIAAMTICPGKYLSLVGGEVSAVESSVRRGREVGAEFMVDSLFIPGIHPQVFPAIMGTARIERIRALGVIETFSVASCIIAADGAAKAAEIELTDLRLAQGLAGKSFVTLTGDVSDVEAAMAEGLALIKDTGMVLKSVVIPRPHEDLKGRLG